MIGEKPQTFFTVKDLAASEFIQAFGQYLKKNNLIERPTWVDIVKLGKSIIMLIQETNWLPVMRIGSTTELPPLQEKFTLGQELESIFFLIFMVEEKEQAVDLKLTLLLAPRLFVGVSINCKSKNLSKKIRKETL